MANLSLESVNWHDLPVSELRLTETGLLLVVTPYNEVTASYDTCILHLTEANTLTLDIVGTLSAKDLSDLEVSTFAYSVEPAGRISGTLGLLPGQAGFWKVSFTHALWQLTEGQAV